MSKSQDGLYPEPPELLSNLSFRHGLKYVGPGLIVASVTIGSGELVMASRSGAIFGYTMMWCFLYAGIFKAAQVYSALRHYTLTGEHPMVSWGAIPGPPLWFPILLTIPTICVMPIAFSALPEILGTFIHRLLKMPLEGPSVAAWGHEEFWYNLWATTTLVGCLAFALWSSYDWVERVSSVVLGALLLCVIVSAAVFGPNLVEILQGMLIPQVHGYDPWIVENAAYQGLVERSQWLEIALYLGAVGGGTFDYIGYVGIIREKGWGLAGRKSASKDELEAAIANKVELSKAKIWIRAPLLDTSISFFLVILVTLLFAILGTQVLHPRQLIPDGGEFLTVQENYLTLLHPKLAILYRMGVFLAFIGTLYGAFLIYRHTVAECLVSIFKKKVPGQSSPRWRRWVYAYCFVGGLTLVWLPQSIAGNIIDRLTFSTIIGGSTTCGLWCFAMLWVDRVRLPKALRMGLGLKGIVLISGLALFGLGLKTIITYFG